VAFHKEYFEFYRALGVSRSTKALADKWKKDQSYFSRLKKKEGWDERLEEEARKFAEEVQRNLILEQTNLTKDMLLFAKEMFLDLRNTYRSLKAKNSEPFKYIDAQGNIRIDMRAFGAFVDKLLPQLMKVDDSKDDQKKLIDIYRVKLPERNAGEY